MKNIAYMKEELERLGIKVELLEDVGTVSLYDNELEETVCYAMINDKEKLYVYIPNTAVCVCDFYKELSISQLKKEVQADTRKNVKKLASEYARARKTYVQTSRDCENLLHEFNKTVKDYSELEPDYKVVEFAYGLQKELDVTVRQAYKINELGE